MAIAVAITTLLIPASPAPGGVGAMPRTGAAIICVGLLSLAGRRQQPLPAAIATVIVVFTSVLTAPQAVKAPVLIAIVLVAYSVIRYASGTRLAAGLSVCIGGVALSWLAFPPERAHGVTLTQLEVVLVLLPAVAAALVRVRGRLPELLEPGLLRGTDARAADLQGDLLPGLGRAGQVAFWIEFGRLHRDRILSVVAAGLVLLVLTVHGVDTGQPARDTAVIGLAVIAVGSIGLVGRFPWPALLAALAAAVSFSWIASLPDAYNSVIGGVVVIGLPLIVGGLLALRPALVALAACLAAIVVMGVLGPAAPISAAAQLDICREVLSSAAIAVGAWSAGRVVRRGWRSAWAGMAARTAAHAPAGWLLPDRDELAERAGILGLRPTAITVDQIRSDEPCPQAVVDAAHHVLDEAIANAAWHAPGAELMITVSRERDAVRIDVINGPATEEPEVTDGPGCGVPAVARRVAAVGGMFCVGPHAGGFAVRARLPISRPGR